VSNGSANLNDDIPWLRYGLTLTALCWVLLFSVPSLGGGCPRWHHPEVTL